MIVIWDNGENYEAAETLLIDAGDRGEELVALLDAGETEGVGRVLGTAEQVTWRPTFTPATPAYVGGSRHAPVCEWDPCTCWVGRLREAFPL